MGEGGQGGGQGEKVEPRCRGANRNFPPVLLSFSGLLVFPSVRQRMVCLLLSC